MDIEISACRRLAEMLLDAVNLPLVLAGAEGAVLYMNSACAGIFDAMDCTGLKITGIIDQPWEKITALNAKHHIEVKLKTVHGTMRGELYVSSLRDEMSGYYVLMINPLNNPDFAGVKSTRDALFESEARNRALIAAIPDIMFRVNSKGEYLDRMLRGKISEIFPVEVAGNALPYISRAVNSREIGIYEYPVTVAGREEYYEARFVAMDMDEILVILRRVTERRTAMMELEKARRDAEQANNAKSEFLANMSHEIRTPLNSITGFIELLIRSDLNESQREFLDIIKKSAAGLLDIINDILDFSKIESHKLELSFVEFNPYSELGTVMKLFAVKAMEKGIRFTWFMDPGIPEVIVSDSTRLKQVLANLLSNAIKFTPDDGAVSAEVRMLDRDETGCRLYFAVTDTGIGIPERKQKQIFEVFTQADNSITRRFGGTGLGLSISMNLVKLLGGELVLESEAGRGSCFSFVIDCGSGYSSCMSDRIDIQGISAGIYSGSIADRFLRNGLAWFLEQLGCEVVVSDSIDGLKDSGIDLMFVIFRTDSSGYIAEHIGSVMCRTILLCFEGDMGHASRLRDYFSEVLVLPAGTETVLNTIRYAMDIAGQDETVDTGSVVALRTYSGSVLIGEDNRINQKLMTLLLRDYGVETVVAGNGLDVFDRYKGGKFDLVLMDIHMPAADGIETTRMIREYEDLHNLPRTPIVALTAKTLKGDRDFFKGNGMDGFLAKPVEMDRLEAVLCRYLAPGPLMADHQEPGRQPAAACHEEYIIDDVAGELRIPVRVLSDLCIEFFRDAGELMEEMKAAVRENSVSIIRNLGHRLKGASANLRFGKLSGLFSFMEEKAASGDKEFDYSSIVNDIDVEISRLKQYFT